MAAVRALQARALTLAQRWLLYAHDEIDMATARIRLRLPGEWVAPKEENFKVLMEEVPVRNKVRRWWWR